MRWLRVEDASAVAACRQAVQNMAERLRFPAARIGQLALAVTEAASNLHKHAEQGSLLLCVNRDGPQPGIDLVTIDAGPGVRDVTAALRDGHSTAGTLGIGLGAIQRLADFADLYSRPGHGTALVARFCVSPPVSQLRCADLIRPITGETECGDAYGAVEVDGAVTAVLCDGLGHGPPAAAGVAAVLDDPAGEPAAGLGNVAASIVSDGQRKSMVSIPGIAGVQARTIRQFEYDVPPGSAVIVHSDGISSRWEAATLPALEARDPLLIAAVLLAEAGVHRDDAGVLVLKP
jgi:anti-sigma regulatory factor (Ser/Thr protein kinase)